MHDIKKIRKSYLSIAADIMIYGVVGLAGLVTIWPFIYVFSMSLSSYEEALKQTVWLFPKGFSLNAYGKIVSNASLWRSYANTIFYTFSGTFLVCLMSVISAYPLSKPKLTGRRFITVYMLVPMYFSGGLIPVFILYNKIGLYNRFWVMILPGMVSVWYIILVKTYFKSIPASLHESAFIDGANDLQILFKIVIPLCKPILAVVALYSAVSIWNSWFNALIFLPNTKLQPLQLFLAKVLVFESPDLKKELSKSSEEIIKNTATMIQLKYAAIIFCTLPIIFSYPFLQKYFVKGALIGSLKE